ncbi:putative tol protein [Rosellinia necatrix]|uniref:Putative tol protein n=1 Tax=Rosellinia necatrix TaxID=77044 RepID=A0A1S8A5V9_ROSNE|nr:putative tol protein [Rosellinia necatrix]
MEQSGGFCLNCSDLQPTYHLRSLFIYSEWNKTSRPKIERSIGDLVEGKGCPLCRLITLGLEECLVPGPSKFDRNDLYLSLLELRYVRGAVAFKPLSKSRSESLGELDTLLLRVSLRVSETRTKPIFYVHHVSTKPDSHKIDLLLDLAVAPVEMDEDDYRSKKYSLEHSAALLRLAAKHSQNRLAKMLPALREGNFLKGREVEDVVDQRLVHSWLRYCDHHHASCEPRQLPSSSHFPIWMIDVKQRMVVKEVGSTARFAALSYVWGPSGTKHLRYTKRGGVDVRLSTAGGLSDKHGDIPTTIKDAMTLCERLCIPYLWVDALCLDQDKLQTDTSDPEKFTMMGMIYASAYVTIVAARGQDSWAGLPGVNAGSRSLSNAIERAGDTCLGIFNGTVGRTVSKSVWNSRAWTFQEMLLSRRLLIFTTEEVLYECCSDSSRRESVVMEISKNIQGMFRPPSLDTTFKPPLDVLDDIGQKGGDFDPYGIYVELVSEYIHRGMSNPNDILRASQAILDALGQRIGSGLFHGILLKHFHDTLVFKVIPIHINSYRSGFPSWSWCGWGPQPRGSERAIVFQDRFECQWMENVVDFYRLDPTAARGGYSPRSRPVFVRIERKEHTTPKSMETPESMELGEYREEWGDRLNHMLVFKGNTVHIRVERTAHTRYYPIEMEDEADNTTSDENDDPEGSDSDDGGDDIRRKARKAGISRRVKKRKASTLSIYASLKRRKARKAGIYDCLKPNLGMRSIELNCEWRDGEPDELEFVEIGGYRAYIPNNNPFGPELGCEKHPVSTILAFLISTDATGTSRRAGLYEFNKDAWEGAVTTARTVYLC